MKKPTSDSVRDRVVLALLICLKYESELKLVGVNSKTVFISCLLLGDRLFLCDQAYQVVRGCSIEW